MEKETRIVPATELKIEIRSMGSEERPVITGYAAPFNKWADIGKAYRERIRPGAFKKTIKEGDSFALWNHNKDKVMGRRSNNTLELVEDDNGLFFRAIPPKSAVQEIERVRDGYVDQCSFGFGAVKEDFNPNLRERELYEVRLFEISVGVPFPAYQETSASIRAQIDNDYDRVTAIMYMVRRGGNLNSEDRAVLESHFLAIRSFLEPGNHSSVNAEEPDDPMGDHSVVDGKRAAKFQYRKRQIELMRLGEL